MIKPLLILSVFCTYFSSVAQSSLDIPFENPNDSIEKQVFISHLGNGFYPTKYVNIDLRYLIKFNQYEGLRTGLGGETNNAFSEKYRLNGYLVYGFRDTRFKYSFGGGFRIAEKSNTWLSLTYTDDLQETGSTKFLTDKRFFQLFEPRLINIDLFYKHITKSLTLEHQLGPKLLTETALARSNIEPTYNYDFVLNNTVYNRFKISSAKIAIQWSPFSTFSYEEKGILETKIGFPKFTFQYTKSFRDVLGSDFNFSKFDFKTIERFGTLGERFSEITLVTGIASGTPPLTHLYHAYPNNITKETILQRFSVAGINSFETMFFNEFFSDKFVTIQLKHALAPFKISPRFKPQLVLITRYAVGDMNNINRHQNITFSTLDKGYTESGFEINKLLLGFGLSLSYRYGAYHLPAFSDNVAFKFTFNLSL